MRELIFFSKKSFYLILCSFLFIQCTSTPKKAGRVTDIGVWQGKLFFSNKKTKEKKWTYITWASDSSRKRFRVDLYTIFYIPLATFVKQDQKNHLWIFDGKKYYFSDNGSKIFEYLIRVPLNPNVSFKLLSFPHLEDQWECEEKKGE